jgi:hypothetical protein
VAKKKVLSEMESRATGETCRVVLPKPYTFWSPEVVTTVNGEESVETGPTLYGRTGTVVLFDSGFWQMNDSFIHENLNEGVTVHYDIPGAKPHSKHTVGTFVASIHSISNLVYHAKGEILYHTDPRKI